MGFSSQAGQVVLKTQATAGVLDPDLGDGVAMKLRGGSLGPNRELLIPDPEIGGGRDVVDAYLGAISWGGTYDFYARMGALPTLLKACLGISASVTATGANTHTITPSDAGQLPFLSIEEKIGAGLEVFNYTDAVVNTLHLEAEANGYLQGTCDMIGARQVAGATPTAAPDWDNSPMMVGTNILVTYNGITLPAKSFSLDINNNFEDDDFRLGSLFLGDLTPKRREITASFHIRESSSALWRQAVYGASGATVPGGLSTKQALVINCNTYEMITGSTPPVTYSLKMDFPKYILKPFDFGPSGDDIIENDVEGQAVRPDPAAVILTATVVNERAVIA